MSPGRFRKKPVEVEAMQVDGTVERSYELLNWIVTNGGDAVRGHSSTHGYDITVGTLEGDMHATPGDWIIRGIQGEFYPCKPDIFAASYEAVPAPREVKP